MPFGILTLIDIVSDPLPKQQYQLMMGCETTTTKKTVSVVCIKQKLAGLNTHGVVGLWATFLGSFLFKKSYISFPKFDYSI